MSEAPTPTPTKLTAEEQATLSDAQKKTQSMMSRIGQPGVQYILVGAAAKLAAERGEPVITAMVPKAFILTLDSAETARRAQAAGSTKKFFVYGDGDENQQVKFDKGIQQVPKALMDHPYVKAHKVEVYNVPTVAPKMEPILGSSLLTKDIPAGGKTYSVSEVNLAAFQSSGLTAAQWNTLTDQQRGEMMLTIVEARQKLVA